MIHSLKLRNGVFSFVGDYSFKKGLDVLILLLDVLLKRENEGISIAQIKMEKYVRETINVSKLVISVTLLQC